MPCAFARWRISSEEEIRVYLFDDLYIGLGGR